MIKGSEIRKADHQIEPLLIDRWSPRAMSGEEISEEELMRLFEAARWAPSSFNAQQWRALYAPRGTEHWQTFFDLLFDANKVWAKNADVFVVFISRKNFDYNDEPSVTHSYDCGAAWENFALQGSAAPIAEAASSPKSAVRSAVLQPNLTLIPARHYRPNYQRQTGSEEGQRNRDSLAPKHMRNRATLFMRGNSVGDPTERP
jgi:nitroreductase